MEKLENFLKDLKTEDWREISNSMIYIRCAEKLSVLKKAGFEVDGRNDGFLALCFVDHDEGLSFYVIAAAHIREERIFVSKENKSSRLIFKMENLSDCKYLNQNFIDVNFHLYSSYVDTIVGEFEKNCSEAVDIRKIMELDSFRKQGFPDDIEILLIGNGIQMERVWVRACKYGENCLYGVLLDEPEQKLNIHKGDVVDFMLVERNGKFSTVHVIK